MKIIRAHKKIRWYGHINRTEESSVLKRITEAKIDENRPIGKPKIRW